MCACVFQVDLSTFKNVTVFLAPSVVSDFYIIKILNECNQSVNVFLHYIIESSYTVYCVFIS